MGRPSYIPEESSYRSRFPLGLIAKRGAAFSCIAPRIRAPRSSKRRNGGSLRTSWIVLGHDCEVPGKGRFHRPFRARSRNSSSIGER